MSYVRGLAILALLVVGGCARRPTTSQHLAPDAAAPDAAAPDAAAPARGSTPTSGAFFPLLATGIDPTVGCPSCYGDGYVDDVDYAFAPVGDLFAAADHRPRIGLWNVAENASAGTLEPPEGGQFQQLAWNDDASGLAVFAGSKVVVFDLATRKVASTFSAGDGALLFARDTIVVREANRARVYAAATGALLRAFPLPLETAACAARGALLACEVKAEAGRAVDVFDLATGKRRAHLAGTGASAAPAIAVHPDGKRVAAYFADTAEIVLWDEERAARSLTRLTSQPARARSIAWSRDATQLVLSSEEEEPHRGSRGEADVCARSEDAPAPPPPKVAPDYFMVVNATTGAPTTPVPAGLQLAGSPYRFFHATGAPSKRAIAPRLGGALTCLPNRHADTLKPDALSADDRFLVVGRHVYDLTTGKITYTASASDGARLELIGRGDFALDRQSEGGALVRLADSSLLARFEGATPSLDGTRLVLRGAQRVDASLDAALQKPTGAAIVELPTLSLRVVSLPAAVSSVALSADGSTAAFAYRTGPSAFATALVEASSGAVRCTAVTTLVTLRGLQDPEVGAELAFGDGGKTLALSEGRGEHPPTHFIDATSCKERDLFAPAFFDGSVYGSRDVDGTSSPSLVDAKTGAALPGCPSGKALAFDAVRRGEPRLLCLEGATVTAWDVRDGRSLGALVGLKAATLADKREDTDAPLRGAFGPRAFAVVQDGAVLVYDLTGTAPKTPRRLVVRPGDVSLEWSGENLAAITSADRGYAFLSDVREVRVWERGLVERAGSPFRSGWFFKGELQRGGGATPPAHLVDERWLATGRAAPNLTAHAETFSVKPSMDAAILVRRSDGAELALGYTVSFEARAGEPTPVHHGFALSPTGMFSGDPAAFGAIELRRGASLHTARAVRASEVAGELHRPALVVDFLAGKPLASPTAPRTF